MLASISRLSTSRGLTETLYRFEIDPFRKQCLLAGADEVGFTLGLGAEIDAFEAGVRAKDFMALKIAPAPSPEKP